jgi:hypothetical protein
LEISFLLNVLESPRSFLETTMNIPLE